MAYGTVNADVIQSSVSGVSLGAGNASTMKNRIINGSMAISQRNGTNTVTPANGDYTIDRYTWQLSQASKLTTNQVSSATNGPLGFQNYMQVTSSSAYSVLTGDYFGFGQRIEGFNTADLQWGTANAKTVTLSFWVNCTLTGTFGGAIINGAFNRSYPFTYSIPVANTWTQISVTIAGDTTGTWVGATNGTGMQVWWGLGVGATYSGTAGSWTGSGLFSATGATSLVGTSGAVWYVTGVQLEVGTSATGYEYRQYQQELALCQRYAYGFPFGANQVTIAIGGGGLYSDSNTVACSMNGVNLFNMRTVPTTVSTLGTQGTDWGFQTSSGVTQTGFTLTTSNGLMIGSKTSHGVSNNNINLRVLTSSGNIVISSEL